MATGGSRSARAGRSVLRDLEKLGYLARPERGGFSADRLSTDGGDCRFEMTRQSAITGRVLDPNGDPVRWVRVHAVPESGEGPTWVQAEPAVEEIESEEKAKAVKDFRLTAR